MLSISAQIGNRIKYYRNQKSISQLELANNADINASYLGEIERGEKNPTIEILEKIIKAFNITFMEFFSFETALNTVNGNVKLENMFDKLAFRSDKEQRMICDVVDRILDFQKE